MSRGAAIYQCLKQRIKRRRQTLTQFAGAFGTGIPQLRNGCYYIADGAMPKHITMIQVVEGIKMELRTELSQLLQPPPGDETETQDAIC